MFFVLFHEWYRDLRLSHVSRLYAALCWAETMMVTDLLDFPFSSPTHFISKVPFHFSDAVPLFRVLHAFSCPFFHGTEPGPAAPYYATSCTWEKPPTKSSEQDLFFFFLCFSIKLFMWFLCCLVKFSLVFFSLKGISTSSPSGCLFSWSLQVPKYPGNSPFPVANDHFVYTFLPGSTGRCHLLLQASYFPVPSSLLENGTGEMLELNWGFWFFFSGQNVLAHNIQLAKEHTVVAIESVQPSF